MEGHTFVRLMTTPGYIHRSKSELGYFEAGPLELRERQPASASQVRTEAALATEAMTQPTQRPTSSSHERGLSLGRITCRACRLRRWDGG